VRSFGLCFGENFYKISLTKGGNCLAVKDVNYFKLFIKQLQICKKAAQSLCLMLSPDSSPSDSITAIYKAKVEGSDFKNKIYEHLARSFLPPIEREDIILISKSIENATTAIYEIAAVFDIFSVNCTVVQAKTFADIILRACTYLVKAATEFEHFKRSKRFDYIMSEIERFEKEKYLFYQNFMKEFLSMNHAPLEIIKWKSIFDAMKAAFCACLNIAETIKDAAIKNR
jgi:uncharacterized protein Yka (UPF0111/DUF47 family)